MKQGTTHRAAAVAVLRDLDGTHRELAALTLVTYLHELGVAHPTWLELAEEASAEQLAFPSLSA